MKYGYATEDGAGCHLHFIGAYTRLGLPTPSSEFCCCCCCLFVSVVAFPDLMELRLATPQQPESNLIHPSSVRLKFPASTISFRSKYSKNSHFRFPLPVLPVSTSGTSGRKTEPKSSQDPPKRQKKQPFLIRVHPPMEPTSGRKSCGSPGIH